MIVSLPFPFHRGFHLLGSALSVGLLFVVIMRRNRRQEGIPGLYRGIGAVMVASLPGSSLYFTTYEATKEFLVDRRVRAGAGDELNFLDHFAAGMLAEIVWCV